MKKIKYVVVGSGIFGSIVAERIAGVLDESVLVIEKRSHIGGNSWSELDPETGIECHRYGSHIFHTSNAKVWEYINRFASFTGYRHKVLITSGDRVFQMPVNLKTINDFFNVNLSPSDAVEFLKEEIRKAGILNRHENLEEKAVSMIGRRLYDAFIRGYTMKQWEHDPLTLPPEIITRLPVRFNYNSDYFSDPWQGVPLDGYGKLFERLLAHPNITVRTNTEFSSIRAELSPECNIIYTGMIDEFFDYKFGMLEWRGLRFEWDTLDVADYQGTSVMNYADIEIPHTRIHEFKHYHVERADVFHSAKTVICREYPRSCRYGENACYPVCNAANRALLMQYEEEAARYPRLIMGGRLGSYKYWDMDKAVENALNCFETKIMKALCSKGN